MDNPIELAETALEVVDSTDNSKNLYFALAGAGTAVLTYLGVNYLRNKRAARKLAQANQENVVIETTAT